MKKLKKQLLLTLYLYGNTVRKGSTFCSYKVLYQLLPFASSSIRGEVSEFVAAGIILEMYDDGEKRFILSDYGTKLVKDLFWRLFDGKEPADHKVTIFLFDRSVKPTEKKDCEAVLHSLGARPLRTGAWILERDFEAGERPALSRFPFLWIGEDAIVTKRFESTMQQSQIIQESFSRPLKKQLNQLHDMIAANLPRPKSAMKTYQELISAFSAYSMNDSRTAGKKLLDYARISIMFSEFSNLSAHLYTMLLSRS